MMGLAGHKANQGEVPEALEYYRQVMEVARDMGNRFAEGMSVGNMATLYFDQGDFTAAQRYFQESIEISREVGNQRGLGIGLGNLAKLHHALGENDKALELYGAALVIVRQIGELRIEGGTLGNLGHLLYSEGRLDSAEEHFMQAISICDKVIPAAAGYYRSLLALIHSDRGKFSEARDLLDTAEAQLARKTRKAEFGKLYCIRARVELAAGDAVAAVAYLSKAEAIAAKMGTKPDSRLGKAIDQTRTLIDG
jgi:tetratricopeptide (TPR) repeat protein